MLWLIPATLIVCTTTFWLGYRFRDLTKKVEHLEEVIQTKVSKPKKISELPQSTVLDPMDEVQTAIYEHDKLMKKMNPE